MQKYKIVISGAGPWGHALIKCLKNNNHDAIIFSRDISSINKDTIDSNINYSEDIDEIVSNSEYFIIASPVSSVQYFAEKFKKNNEGIKVLVSCKGMDPNSGSFPSEILSNYIHEDNIAVLSGPSFANEVYKGMPTAVTIASSNPSLGKEFSDMFHAKNFRVYNSSDVIGCQLGGAIKNVLALAVGISDGLDLGPNAKAALITRGMNEFKELGNSLKCNPQTIYGLSGVGDLVLTANDNQSRNRFFGIEIGKGKKVEDIKNSLSETVEGIYAVDGIMILSKKFDVKLPICEQVYNILHGTISPNEAVDGLLEREPRMEV
ncbi:MAG: NAD(P)H-dependent glycerol-3-phosphate dehydrogenase [Pseudomonadota bacterium]|nr:NAD(P)H-dependent glycerol-3-phosphate dehydrogenase [Pseudomonadota bacterium]